MARKTLTRDELAGAAASALGGRRLAGVERLAGGTQKGVYRLTMDDATTAVAYVWDASENYWPSSGTEPDPADPFSPSLGLDYFEPAWQRLEAIGLRVPDLYLVDRERTHFPADIAIVEDVPGERLMEFQARDPQAARPTMAQLAEALTAMREYRAPRYGKVAFVDGGGTSLGASGEEVALAFGLRCLAGAAALDSLVAGARERLEERLRELAAAVRPRAEYSVVHGELGLDHVLVDRAGRPVVIDIESLRYFDVEWEHVFLRIRLHDDYPHFAVDGLDEDRLALYMLAQRLSLTSGPLSMLTSDFHNPELFREIAEHNRDQALAWVDGRTPRVALTGCCTHHARLTANQDV